jgi:c-di-GMP-binding flagellar brake protein YcgR
MFFRNKKTARTSNRRKNYRKGQSPAYSLSVEVVTPSGPTAGEFLDLSVQGVGARFLLEHDPRLARGDVVELTIASLSHGKVKTPARVIYSQSSAPRHVRYGFEFINIGNLYSQLDNFYARLFNRRASIRVRPALDRKVRLRLSWKVNELEANVNEISTGGVGLIMNEADALRLKDVEEVGVAFRLPGVKLEFSGKARILNRKTAGERVFLGLAFDLTDPQGLVLQAAELQKFVEERTAEMERWEQSWT